MAYTIRIDMSGVLEGQGLRDRLEAMAEVLEEQTITRIEQGGDDEIRFEPLDFERPEGGKENPLYDTGTHLRDSITKGTDGDSEVWVGSTFIGAPVHQYGTKGKGGELDTIVPKRAKALFIPLTPKAKKSVVANGQRMASVIRNRQRVHEELVKGIDFIFVNKVDIHPRPFLRLSEQNVEELARTFGIGRMP